MKKPHLHSSGSTRFSASFINRMLLLCLLGIVMPQAIYSATSYSVQQRETVSGVIIDANTQETIIGASIMLKGSSHGTVTDIDGKFSLSVSELPVTLVVSCVGYQTKEVKISSFDGTPPPRPSEKCLFGSR